MTSLTFKARLTLVCAAISSNTSYAFATTATTLTTISTDIERINIVGQINSLMLESEIDLTASSSPDLRKQLKQLPSVNINGNGQVSGIIQYRGLYSERVRVTIDDNIIVGAGPNAMDSPLSHVMASGMQKVTLYHGIAPISAGAETIGGAIDISDIAPEYSGTSQFEYAGAFTFGRFNNNATNMSAYLQASNDQFYFTINADLQEGNNYRTGTGITVPSTFYSRKGTKLRAGFERGAHTLNWSLSSRSTDASGTPALAMDIDYIDALIGTFDYRYKINDDWQVKTKFSANNNEHDMDNFSYRLNEVPAAYRINSVDSEGRTAAVSLLHENSNWQNEYGINVEMREHNSRITNPNNEAFYLQNFSNVQRNLHSLYAQLQYHLDRELPLQSWQIGLRTSTVEARAGEVDTSMAMMAAAPMMLRDNFNVADRDRDFNLFDGVIKATFVLDEQIKFLAASAIKQRAPIYSQLYSWFPLGVSAGLADGRNYIGKLDLKKESAKKIDLGLLIEGENWVFMPNVFYTKIDDYIIGQPSNNQAANMIAVMNNIQTPLQWQNRDAKLVGADLSYSKQINDAWSIRVAGQYIEGELQQNASSESNDLYRLAPMSANVQLQWKKERFNLALQGTFVAAQKKVSTEQNESPTSGYGVVDFHLSYQFNTNIEIKLLAENLFDKSYVDHLSGLNRVNGSELAQGEKIPSPSRNLGLYFSASF